MATFKVDLPNGTSYEIDAEDERQVNAIVSQLSGKKSYNDPTETDPNNQEYQAKYGPTRGFLGNAWDSLGKAGSKFASGVEQLNAAIGSVVPNALQPAYQADLQGLHQRTANEQETDRYLNNTGGNILGTGLGIVGTAGPAAFIPGANTYAGTAAVGGLLGASQPVTNERDRLINAGTGAAVSLAAKYGLDKLGSALVNRAANKAKAQASASANASSEASAEGGAISQETGVQGSPTIRAGGGGSGYGSVGEDVSALTASQKEILAEAKKLGFKTTPGQETGSRALQQVEAKLESQPMTSGPFNKIKIENSRALNKTVAKAIGVDANSVDSAVIDQAFRKASNVFDNAADDVPRSIEPKKFVETYSAIQNDLEGVYEGFGNHPLVKRLVGLAESGQPTGQQLQSLSSKLSRAAYKNMTGASGDRDLGMALYRVKDYVDDLLQQGMAPERLAAFKAARENYRNLMLITSRVGIVNPSTGNVSGANLANALQMRDKMGFLRGANQSDMYTAARFAQAFKPLVGDSGTATRSMVANPMDFVVSLPFNIATRAYVSAPSIRAVAGAQSASNALGTAGRNALASSMPVAQKVGPTIAGSAASNVAANALLDKRIKKSEARR